LGDAENLLEEEVRKAEETGSETKRKNSTSEKTPTKKGTQDRKKKSHTAGQHKEEKIRLSKTEKRRRDKKHSHMRN